MQVIADPHGELIWVSPALPGSVHDLKAARTHGILAALTGAAVADKGYRGARGAGHLPTRMREVNAAHAKVPLHRRTRLATFESWRLLDTLRCCPKRATALAAAILTRHLETRS